jgi:hypothetical protein
MKVTQVGEDQAVLLVIVRVAAVSHLPFPLELVLMQRVFSAMDLRQNLAIAIFRHVIFVINLGGCPESARMRWLSGTGLATTSTTLMRVLVVINVIGCVQVLTTM